MIIYTFTDSRGVNHDIRQRDIEEAYRHLLFAGYSMHDAHDKSLDYLIAKLTIGAVPQIDLLYGNHSYQAEERLCAEVAHRVAMKHTQKETKNVNYAKA
jgi:hypothetical protein